MEAGTQAKINEQSRVVCPVCKKEWVVGDLLQNGDSQQFGSQRLHHFFCCEMKTSLVLKICEQGGQVYYQLVNGTKLR